MKKQKNAKKNTPHGLHSPVILFRHKQAHHETWKAHTQKSNAFSFQAVSSTEARFLLLVAFLCMPYTTEASSAISPSHNSSEATTSTTHGNTTSSADAADSASHPSSIHADYSYFSPSSHYSSDHVSQTTHTDYPDASREPSQEPSQKNKKQQRDKEKKTSTTSKNHKKRCQQFDAEKKAQKETKKRIENLNPIEEQMLNMILGFGSEKTTEKTITHLYIEQDRVIAFQELYNKTSGKFCDAFNLTELQESTDSTGIVHNLPPLGIAIKHHSKKCLMFFLDFLKKQEAALKKSPSLLKPAVNQVWKSSDGKLTVPLIEAITLNQKKTVEQLIAAGARLTRFTPNTTPTSSSTVKSTFFITPEALDDPLLFPDESPLHTAARLGNTDLTQLLLETIKNNISEQDSEGYTAIERVKLEINKTQKKREISTSAKKINLLSIHLRQLEQCHHMLKESVDIKNSRTDRSLSY